MSPEPAAGSLLRRPPIPCTAITYKFFAPVKKNIEISKILNLKQIKSLKREWKHEMLI